MSEEEIIENANTFIGYNVLYGQIAFIEPVFKKYQETIQGLLDLYNKEKEKNEQILGNNVESFQKLFAEEISKIYISKDKIREMKEFYINDCKNRNITLIPLENLIKNINKLLEE